MTPSFCYAIRLLVLKEGFSYLHREAALPILRLNPYCEGIPEFSCHTSPILGMQTTTKLDVQGTKARLSSCWYYKRA